MRKIRVIHVTFAASVSLVSLGFFACSSSTTNTETTDSGTDTSTNDDTSMSSDTSMSADSKHMKDSSKKEDVTSNEDASDSPLTDSSDAAEDSGPKVCTPLNLCTTLDQIFGAVPDGAVVPAYCATETNNNCPDRADDWVAPIYDQFLGNTAPSGYADCRIQAIFGQTSTGGLLTADEYNNYTNTGLPNYIYAFMGCPLSAGDAGAEAAAANDNFPPYGLIPLGFNQTFTTADIALLSSLWVQTINATIAAFSVTSVTALTTDQVNAINAELACEASNEPHIVTSANYNFSICPADAGPEGGDGGHDGGDSGHD
jgi:hypothetical protein